MLQKRSAQFLLTLFFSVCIIVSCAWAYGDHVAMGATGDDSPGYIYLASLMARGEPLLWQDELGKKALDFFGDYKYASWILPTHHEFIHPNGTIASKYPLGASLLLAGFAFIGRFVGDGSVLGMYWMQPVLGGVIVLFTYWFALVLFPQYRIARHIVGLTAAATLALADVFYDIAISYPMREIPSMALLLLSALLFVPTMRLFAADMRVQAKSAVGFLLFGIVFGLACTVRETSVVILPAFIGYAVIMTWSGNFSVKALMLYVRSIWQTVVIIVLGFCIGIAPIVWNAVQITTHNEPFKERDSGNVVVLSNINHLQTVSVKNVFESTGRYRPANGSLGQYWIVLNRVSSLPFIPLFAIGGFCLLFFSRNKEERATSVLLGGWVIGTLTMFSLWINPYSRYILPLIPIVLLLAASGWLLVLQHSVRLRLGNRFAFVIAVIMVMSVAGSLIEPLRLMKIDHAVNEYPDRALTATDAGLLDAVADTVSVNQPKEKVVVFFTGVTRSGLSEVFMAHTDIRGARLPFEEEKDQPDPVQVENFLRELVGQGYMLYVVMPINPEPEVVRFKNNWIEAGGNWQAQQVSGKSDIDFTFAQDTTLIRLSK